MSSEPATGAVYIASNVIIISLATIAKTEVDSVAPKGWVKSEHFPTPSGIYLISLPKARDQADLRLAEKLNV